MSVESKNISDFIMLGLIKTFLLCSVQHLELLIAAANGIEYL